MSPVALLTLEISTSVRPSVESYLWSHFLFLINRNLQPRIRVDMVDRIWAMPLSVESESTVSGNHAEPNYLPMYFRSRGPKSLLFTPSALVGGGGVKPEASITL